MSIKFLSVSEAQYIIYTDEYFNCFNESELMIRTKGYGKDYYYHNLLEFSKEEKFIIERICNISLSLMTSKIPKLVPKNTIGFIKVKAGVDWDYPFTIGNNIVLSEVTLRKFIDGTKLSNDYSQVSAKQWNLWRPQATNILEHATLITHEIIHITQRNPTPLQYNNILSFYKDWGFRKIHPNSLVLQTTLPPLITNPDGYNFNYIVQVYSEGKWNWLLPTLIYSQDKPRGIIFKLTPLSDGRFIVTNDYDFIEKFGKYKDMFPIAVEQLYHPNEIFATLVSEWLIKDIVHTDHLKFYEKLNSMKHNF